MTFTPRPDTWRDRVSDDFLSAAEMSERMTALVARFDRASLDLRVCSDCRQASLVFGALWIDGEGWYPIQACLVCRRLYLEPVSVVHAHLEASVRENTGALRDETPGSGS